MFIQSRVVYVIDENAENEIEILKDLNKIGLTEFFFKKKVSTNDKVFSAFIRSLPPGTVFCIDLDYQENTISEKVYNIAIPFLSSHFKLPVKLGEVIWFYKYSLGKEKQLKDKAYNIDGYYLGRVHSLNNTEDTSYCFFDRESTYFDLTKNDIFDSFARLPNQGAIEILDFNQNASNYKDCMYVPHIDFMSSYSKDFLNTAYFAKKIKSHGLKPQPNTKNFVTDIVLKGTYNSSIKLTKTSLNNIKEMPDVQRDLNNFNSGKIELIAGENENKRRNSEKIGKLYSKIDKEGSISPDFIELCYYDEIICPEVNNNLFFEKVKSVYQFPNAMLVSDSIKNLVSKKYNHSLYSDLSKFIISEHSIEDGFIKDTYLNNSKTITYDVSTQTISSSLHEKSPLDKTFKTAFNVPKIKNITNEEDKKLSSLVGISDNISFVTHSNTDGQITLLKPNAKDKKSSYILINQDGNINVQGNKILIGEYNRLESKSNGGNALVFLGHSEEMQSLVLGEQLKIFLKEALDVQRQSMDDIKDLFFKSKDTKSTMNENTKKNIVPPTFTADIDKNFKAITTPVFNLLRSNPTATATVTNGSLVGFAEQFFSLYTQSLETFLIANLTQLQNDNDAAIKQFEEEIKNTLLKRNEDLSLRLKSIEDNIHLILSKFTKTS